MSEADAQRTLERLQRAIKPAVMVVALRLAQSYITPVRDEDAFTASNLRTLAFLASWKVMLEFMPVAVRPPHIFGFVEHLTFRLTILVGGISHEEHFNNLVNENLPPEDLTGYDDFVTVLQSEIEESIPEVIEWASYLGPGSAAVFEYLLNATLFYGQQLQSTLTVPEASRVFMLMIGMAQDVKDSMSGGGFVPTAPGGLEQ